MSPNSSLAPVIPTPATAILDAHPHLSVLGLDRDPLAVQVATERLARFGDRAHVVHTRFDRIADAMISPSGRHIVICYRQNGTEPPRLAPGQLQPGRQMERANQRVLCYFFCSTIWSPPSGTRHGALISMHSSSE